MNINKYRNEVYLAHNYWCSRYWHWELWWQLHGWWHHESMSTSNREMIVKSSDNCSGKISEIGAKWIESSDIEMNCGQKAGQAHSPCFQKQRGKHQGSGRGRKLRKFLFNGFYLFFLWGGRWAVFLLFWEGEYGKMEPVEREKGIFLNKPALWKWEKNQTMEIEYTQHWESSWVWTPTLSQNSLSFIIGYISVTAHGNQ